MTLGEKLLYLRKKNKVKVAAIVDYIGISRQAYNKIEKDKTNPRTALLSKIADFFGVTTDYLVGKTNYLDGVTISNDDLPDRLKEKGINQLKLGKILLEINNGLNDELIDHIIQAYDTYQKSKIENKNTERD